MEFNQAQHIHKLHIRRFLTLVLISVLIFNTVMPANASSGNFSRSATARKGQSTALEEAGSISGLSPLDAYPPPEGDSLIQPETQEANPTIPDNPYPAPEGTLDGDETSIFLKAWDSIVSLFSVDTSSVSAHSDPSSQQKATSSSAPASSETINYGYDALNRLTSANYASGLSYSFTYDKVGNRSSQTVDGVNTTYVYDAADRLTNAGGIAFTWDDNGNLLNDGVNTYSYDFANRLIEVTLALAVNTGGGQGSSFSFRYDGLDNRYQQTVNAQTTTYLLDQATGLSQVLYDGNTSYDYGLGRISQQKNGVSDYFLTDALGSVRQLTNAHGNITLSQSFDPFGNSIGQFGQSGSHYGYAGEWMDASGLQYLRARYYSPEQGRFITKDPFPGFLSQPSTLNAYAYVTNNPILMNDPSGQIASLLIAAGLGGLIGAGIDIGRQLYNMQPTSLGEALRCLNWGEVGASFGAGMVAGLTGFTVFGGLTALMGTGFFANVAAGAISGVIAGQYGRLTGLVLSGQISQIGSALFRPQDLVLDAALGGVGGIGYGIGRLGGRSKPIVNSRGIPYPEVDVPGYGKVPFPNPPYTPNNSSTRAQEFTNAFKKVFQNWWKNQGLSWSEGEVNIHHIKPLRFGGTNTFENLVPLSRPQHDLFTNWWRYFQ